NTGSGQDRDVNEKGLTAWHFPSRRFRLNTRGQSPLLFGAFAGFAASGRPVANIFHQGTLPDSLAFLQLLDRRSRCIRSPLSNGLWIWSIPRLTCCST